MKNQILSTNFHSLLRYILYFSYGFSKQAENKNKNEKKIIIILVVNAAWKLFESGTESTQLLNEFNSLARLIYPAYTVLPECTLSRQQWVLPQLFFFSVLIMHSFLEPIDPLMKQKSKHNQNIFRFPIKLKNKTRKITRWKKNNKN